MLQRFSEREVVKSRLPVRWMDLPQPPSSVFLQGELPGGPCVSVVGTRHPTDKALRYARRLSYELARAGVAVLSGGAEGIDTAAHRGALDARGCTVVVAPCGFDHPFPPENAALFRSVVRRGGAYLSLVPANIAATPPAFFRRNACLAALCHVLVLVEAPLRSGARNAVKHAKRLGRPVLVVPSPPWNPKGLGCIEELKHGGRPLSGAGDVLSWLKALRLHAVSAPTQLAPRPRAPEPTPKTDPDGDLDAITAALRHGARHANQLCAQTGLPAARVQRALLTLTLQGVLGSDAAGWLKFLSS